MFLYATSSDSSSGHSRESNDSSSVGSLIKSAVGKVLADHSSETVTQQPIHPEPEQTSKSF
jgi:hypothetical protein